MDLDLTPEQELLRETVRGVCARHAGPEIVRQMEDDPIGYPEKFWLQLAELGLLGLTLPEVWGGSGMSMLDAAVVYQELGRALAPSPHFVSSVMSGGVLALAGSEAQKAEWLPRLATGGQRAFLHHVLHPEPALDDDEAVRLLHHHANEAGGGLQAVAIEGLHDVVLRLHHGQCAHGLAAMLDAVA